MRWLMLTRKLDPADARAGFMLRWVEALASRLDHLDVICQESANPPLPDNVRVFSLGKEAGVGRAAQARHMVQYLRQLTPQVDGIFCHMISRYVLFAAPWARLNRKPLLFWYTHRSASLETRLAHRLATHHLTAAPGSYPLPTAKLHVMGHGIEINQFPLATQENDPPEIVLVARLSRSKYQDRLLRAAVLAHERGAGPLRLIFVGGAVEHEPGYTAELEALAAEHADTIPVTFTGPLPHDQVAATLQNCALAVNLSAPGHFDKAALEAMLTGKPTLVTNSDFLPLLGVDEWLCLPHDAGDELLAERLMRGLALAPAERAALGQQLRARTAEAHSLDGLMDRIVALMREVTSHG